LNEKNTITDLAPYLKATTHCEVDNDAIAKIVKSVTKGLTSESAKAKAIFNYVKDTLSYSFYYNTKYGAVGTLTAKKGNCVDHTHLLVAMFRTANLPARYVHGSCTFSSGSTYGHVWAQVLIDGKWTIADATSSRNSLGSVANWNTKSFHLNGIYTGIEF
jgi:transglutaminase-like putative cysteine protease